MITNNPPYMVLIHNISGKEINTFGADYLDYNEERFTIKGKKKKDIFTPQSLF